jgi:sphinganine C4-monooxygenase
MSGIFHLIDVYDVFPQYRLHTPEEITQRNHATRLEVARDVLIEQAIQIATAAFLSLTDLVQMVGKEDYDVAVWATRIRLAQGALPSILGLVGLNAATISKNMASTHPMLAAVLAGGRYSSLAVELDGVAGGPKLPGFAAWELAVAKLIYWAIIPTFQFWAAVAFLDTWQYFWHRAMHVNKWMYSEFLPSPPHRCHHIHSCSAA